MPRALSLTLWLCASALCVAAYAPSHVFAQESTFEELSPLSASPTTREMNRHFYARLRKDPWRALGWEALVPGAGSAYTGIHVQAIVTLSISVLGAGMWTAGALMDHDALWWAGASTFAAARVYGLFSAPIGAMLLNAAFRRQLGIAQRF